MTLRQGLRRLTPEHKAKIAAAHKGKRHSTKHKQNISLGRRRWVKRQQQERTA
jgi:hypothetical protein